MKKILSIALFCACCVQVYGEMTWDTTIDMNAVAGAPLRVFQANPTTIKVQLQKNATNLNCAGYSPFFYWAVTEKSTSMVTAQVAWVTQTTGVFTATFTAANLNTNGNLFIYGAGVSSNGVNTLSHGQFRIVADPYAQGAGALSYTGTVVLTLPTSTNGLTAGSLYRSGTNIFIYQ